MQQCRIWGRGTGNAGEWETLTQGTQGKKRKICRSIPAASFSPVFALRVAGLKSVNKSCTWGPSVAWFNFGANLCSVIYARNFAGEGWGVHGDDHTPWRVIAELYSASKQHRRTAF